MAEGGNVPVLGASRARHTAAIENACTLSTVISIRIIESTQNLSCAMIDVWSHVSKRPIHKIVLQAWDLVLRYLFVFTILFFSVGIIYI